MEPYRYQQIAYLIVPLMLGAEFFLSARDEKKDKTVTPVGSYVLEFFGFIFTALIPAMFLFTIWAIEFDIFPLQAHTLARIDRYGVLFFFFGAWWQTYIFAALRSRRLRLNNRPRSLLWVPFLLIGVYISLLILWVSPWNMKWISVGWFTALFTVLSMLSLKTVERIFWILTGFVFIVENLLFIWLETII